jgi:ATP-dependent Clp protease ATP-binding subunit ClpA
MTYSLSTSAQETLEAAQAVARRFHQDQVGSEHILIALSLNHDIARDVFKALDITTEAIRGQVAEVSGHGTVSGSSERPLTSEVEILLDEAWKISAIRDDESVWPVHLLLAITEFQNTGLRILVRCGADLDELARLAAETLKTSPSPSKEPMDLDIVDTSVGTQNLTHQITRTARILVPRNHQHGRESVLQAVVVNTPLEKDCRATVSVLNDQLSWTELLSLPASEWRPQVPLPDPHGYVDHHKLARVADDLLSRTVRILGA